MIAVGCYQDDASSKRLVPQNPTGQRFLEYFHHNWSFIHALNPEPGQRPAWRTEKRYPLELRNLWSQYQDDTVLLGLSFGEETNYLVFDIDSKSVNHPENDQERFEGIMATMETIGLCRPVPVQSSDSEGIHLYYFLPWDVHSFTLAVAVKHTLINAGYLVRDGELEIFPNAKPYSVGKPTSFKAHRLPLQQRSFLLDWDLQPTSNSVDTLLDKADWSASGQDMEALNAVMTQAQQWAKQQYVRKRGVTTAEQFRFDLEEIIREGWTGYGQTNDLLLSFAKYGIIFLGHSGEKLVQNMLQTALQAPGYTQFCRHQHEIEKRVRERARSAEKYPYYPHAGNPPRDKTYKEHFYGAGESNVVALHPSQQRHEETLERITSVVAMLKGEGAFPDTAYKRTQAIMAKSKEVHGVGGSQTTLHKPQYLPLWHPAHEIIGRVNPDGTVEKYPILPNPWEEAEEAADPVVVKGSTDLHVPPHYEGFMYLLAPASSNATPDTSISSENQQQEENLNTTPSATNSFQEPVSQTVVNSSSPIASPVIPSYLIFLSIEAVIHVFFSCQVFQTPDLGGKQINSVRPPRSKNSTLTDKRGLSPSQTNPSDSPGEEAVRATPPPVVRHKPPSVSVITSQKEAKAVPSSSSAAGEDASGDSEQESPSMFTPEQYRDAIRYKLHIVPKVKQWLRVFCATEGIRLMPALRELMEQYVKHHLMLTAESLLLLREAEEWFDNHPGIQRQAESLGIRPAAFRHLQ